MAMTGALISVDAASNFRCVPAKSMLGRIDVFASGYSSKIFKVTSGDSTAVKALCAEDLDLTTVDPAFNAEHKSAILWDSMRLLRRHLLLPPAHRLRRAPPSARYA